MWNAVKGENIIDQSGWECRDGVVPGIRDVPRCPVRPVDVGAGDTVRVPRRYQWDSCPHSLRVGSGQREVGERVLLGEAGAHGHICHSSGGAERLRRHAKAHPNWPCAPCFLELAWEEGLWAVAVGYVTGVVEGWRSPRALVAVVGLSGLRTTWR